MRRATFDLIFGGCFGGISIHALHEESDSDNKASKQLQPISIHALHEESDKTVGNILSQLRKISIHALHEESDRIRC